MNEVGKLASFVCMWILEAELFSEVIYDCLN